MHARYTHLQVLRFLAAAAIVLYHSQAFYQDAGGTWPNGFLHAIAFAGVDIFFVLSGFIIYRTTAGDGGLRDAGIFAWKRMSRIFLTWLPVFALVVWTAVELGPTAPDTETLFTSMLLLPQPLEELVLPVTWTLTYELLFYGLVAVALLVFRDRRGLWIVGAALLVAAVAVPDQGWQVGFDGDAVPAALLSPYVILFFAGAALAALHERRPIRLGWPLVVLGVAGFAAAGWYNLVEVPGALAEDPVLRCLVLVWPSVALVAGAVGAESRRPAPAALVLAGDASYALYLLHYPLLVLWRHTAFPIASQGQELVIIFGAVLVGILLASLVLHVAVERPVLSWTRSLAGVPADTAWQADVPTAWQVDVPSRRTPATTRPAAPWPPPDAARRRQPAWVGAPPPVRHAAPTPDPPRRPVRPAGTAALRGS